MGLFVSVSVVCVRARHSELKIDAAFEGVVSNATADPKIRKPVGRYSSKSITRAGKLLQMCSPLLKDSESHSTLICTSSIVRCDLYKLFDPSYNSHMLRYKAGSVL